MIFFHLSSILNSLTTCLFVFHLFSGLSFIPLLAAVVFTLLFGWLADAIYGNYKVFRFGVTLLFLSAVINCLMLILGTLVWEDNNTAKLTHLIVAGTLFSAGICVCSASSLPLGLDQMPDASASSISSFITWYVFSICTGLWLENIFRVSQDYCFDGTVRSNFSLLLALFSVLCISVVLLSVSVFLPKWFIVEPKSPQTLKNIYKVLKFAVKHKAPLNRSALTYWEEDIPSRIDLGKSKYGGPFTTEEVEDVKTVLRLIVFGIPLSLATFSSTLNTKMSGDVHKSFPGLSLCSTNIVYYFTYSSSICSVFGIVVYEFVVFPLVRNRLPNIRWKIGFALLLLNVFCSICFALKLVEYIFLSDTRITEWIISVLYDSMTGLVLQMLLISTLEFMCAQSPYNMRGLLISFVLPLYTFLGFYGEVFGKTLVIELCHEAWCGVVSFSVKTLVCFIGFIVYCLVARWYKVRVRDEDYSPQRVVEEVYDRYLTAAAANSNYYGTTN